MLWKCIHNNPDSKYNDGEFLEESTNTTSDQGIYKHNTLFTREETWISVKVKSVS